VTREADTYTAYAAASAARPGGIALMHGERELTTGLLSKDASFRLIVTGSVGEKEIDRLIRKLELDKEILADNTDDEAGNNVNPLPQRRITTSQHEQLRSLGWDADDIRGMTYEQAIEAIQSNRTPD
jgi:Holliday junction resolvasome RuvABC DNA-binding subunit